MDIKTMSEIKPSIMTPTNGYYPIFTSYYAVKKEIKEPIHPISISIVCPDTTMEQILDVAPNNYALNYYKQEKYKNPEKAEEIFKDMYRRKISELMQSGRLKEIAKKLIEYAKEKPVVLFCYENPNDFCHRHLLAKTLNKFYSLGITELITPGMAQRELKKAQKEIWNSYKSPTTKDNSKPQNSAQMKLF